MQSPLLLHSSLWDVTKALLVSRGGEEIPSLCGEVPKFRKNMENMSVIIFVKHNLHKTIMFFWVTVKSELQRNNADILTPCKTFKVLPDWQFGSFDQVGQIYLFFFCQTNMKYLHFLAYISLRIRDSLGTKTLDLFCKQSYWNKLGY